MLLAALATGAPGCHNASVHPASPNRSALNTGAQPSIPQMLADLNAHLNPANGYTNSKYAEVLRTKLTTQQMEPKELMMSEFEYAKELMNAGDIDEAMFQFNRLENQLQSAVPEIWKEIGTEILTQHAVAFMRMGEDQNCCARNNERSCLVPISGKGVHTKQEGSRGALKLLNVALKLNPNDLSARWLLNIAYMTLGEYPAKVPKRWIVPANKLGGDLPMQKFYNAAPEMGVDYLGWAGGVIMDDFEGNGLLDLMISSCRRDGQLRYFHNNGDGTFSERTKEAGLAGEIGGLNIVTTDYNNDGKPDVVVLRGGWMKRYGHYPLSLLRNDGKGHFTDVTIEAGLLSLGPTQSAVALDYNGDGLLDLFVSYESSKGDPVPCKLFRNNGDGTFTDVAPQCGLNITRYVKSAVSADFMHNGKPGLYLSCLDGPSILIRNDGPAGADTSAKAAWKFTDISETAGVSKLHKSFSCFFFDYDNDGWPDLFVCGYNANGVGEIAADYLGLPTNAEKSKLYHNNHDGTFTDVTSQAHLNKVIMGMGLNYGDLDNDGWLDFYAGTGNPNLETLIPKRMFRNHDGKYFDEVTTTGDFGHLQKGHAIAFGDLNNNGQQDVFTVLGGAYDSDSAHCCLFVNPGNKNHWITLKLTGTKSNRSAIGAEVCATVDTGSGIRHIYRTVGPGASYGNNPLRLELGLGNAKSIQDVTIRWPASGIIQKLTALKMDRFYTVSEGAATAEPWKLPTFKLPHQGLFTVGND